MTTRLILKNINTAKLDAQVRKARRLSGAKWTRSGLIVEALNQLRESDKLDQPETIALLRKARGR